MERDFIVFLRQVLAFSIVGLSNTLLAYAVYAFLIWCGWHYWIANALAFLVSVTNAYYWSNLYVFPLKDNDRKRNHVSSYIKTVLAYSLTGIFLNSAILYIFVESFSVNDYLAQLYCLLISVPVNFILNKYWSFQS